MQNNFKFETDAVIRRTVSCNVGGRPRAALGLPEFRVNIFVIGVEHRIMWIPQSCGPEWSKYLNEFATHVESVSSANATEMIAEEFNQECFSQNTVDTVARCVAKRMDKQHLFCEPSKTERASMDQNKLREERESYWLRKLEISGAASAVFICGDDHVETFSNLAKMHRHMVHVASCKKWGYGWQLKT